MMEVKMAELNSVDNIIKTRANFKIGKNKSKLYVAYVNIISRKIFHYMSVKVCVYMFACAQTLSCNIKIFLWLLLKSLTNIRLESGVRSWETLKFNLYQERLHTER